MIEADFIEANKKKSVAEIALLLSKKPELDSSFILAQLMVFKKQKTNSQFFTILLTLFTLLNYLWSNALLKKLVFLKAS